MHHSRPLCHFFWQLAWAFDFRWCRGSSKARRQKNAEQWDVAWYEKWA